MFLIANNISTREAKVERILRQAESAGWDIESEPARMLKSLVKQCLDCGADALEINTQQHDDRPEAMDFAVRVAQQVTDGQLCLSTNNAETLEAGLKACRRPPLANYVSPSGERLQEMLPAVARYGAGVILLVSDPVMASDAREMLQKTAILVGAANEVGIPNDSILIDPGLIHITGDAGQRHMVEVFQFLRALSDVSEPAVKSTCWLANCSAGAPPRSRPVIETALLSMLAGAGLSSVFLNVLRPQNRRIARLIKIFNNELIYSDGELES